MGTSSSDGGFEALAARTVRASALARFAALLAFVLPTLVAGAIVWNGALRITKLDARMKLERGRTRQVIDSLRHQIDEARAPTGETPHGDTVRMRDTMRVGDTVRIRSTDTIRIRTIVSDTVRIRTIDSAEVRRLRGELVKLQQAATRATEANAACARNVKVLQDSVARLNAIIKRLQAGARPPLNIRRNP